MQSNPTDFVPAIIVIVGALVLLPVAYELLNRHGSRVPRLRMLSGTRTQRAALALALAPVVREFLPLLDKAGQEIRAIVLVPTLSGADGEPLAAEVEQLSGSGGFIVRLAHRHNSTVRQPEEVAGALSEDLLYLYRHAASVEVIRQTIANVPARKPLPDRPVGRNGLAALPRHSTQSEAEETVVQFKPNPLGRNNNNLGG
jgi:hypothetical protein